MNQFDFVQAVDCFGERVVIAVAATAHGELDSSFGQRLAVPNGYVVGPPVAVLDQGMGAPWLPVIQSLH